VRFLVDENRSPQLCQFLTASGDVAEHAHEALGPGSSDQDILTYATDLDAVIVTADTDFGVLLAQGQKSGPSVFLMGELLSLPVADQGRLLSANLDQIRGILTKGAIVVFRSPTSACALCAQSFR
jgi:predicted nuclease of predicted toxin-antitoxin system